MQNCKKKTHFRDKTDSNLALILTERGKKLHNHCLHANTLSISAFAPVPFPFCSPSSSLETWKLGVFETQKLRNWETWNLRENEDSETKKVKNWPISSFLKHVQSFQPYSAVFNRLQLFQPFTTIFNNFKRGPDYLNQFKPFCISATIRTR